MRMILAAILIATLGSSTRAEDIRAKTADGREVVLKDDGTWSFVEVPAAGPSDGATVAYEGKRKTFAIRLKPDTWNKADKPVNPVAEVMFTHKEGELYAMVVAERITIPLPALKDAALANMKTVDPDARIVEEETRKVDGVDVLCVTSEVTAQGIPLMFYNYYYSGPAGSIQVITWTGRNLFDEMKPEMDKFLNGLTILKKE